MEELETLVSQNQPWIEAQKNILTAIAPSISVDEVMDAFKEGLFVYFKQQYRLETPGSQKNKIIPNQFTNPEYLQQEIGVYTFEFINLLKSSLKYGATPNMALEIAKFAYRHNADTVKKLSKKYKSVGPGVIRRTLVLHPKSSAEFLQNYETKLAELTLANPDVDEGIIKQGLQYDQSKIEEYIKKILARSQELHDKFPSVKMSAINRIVLQYQFSKHEKAIADFSKRVGDLGVLFPLTTNVQLRKSVIEFAALNFDLGADVEFIQGYLKKVPILLKEHSEIEPWIIRRAAAYHSNDSEGYLKKSMKEVADLIKEFSGIPPEKVTSIYFNKRTKYRKLLEEMSSNKNFVVPEGDDADDEESLL